MPKETATKLKPSKLEKMENMRTVKIETANMRHLIHFGYQGSDAMIEVEINHPLQVGDIAHYYLTPEDMEYLGDDYPHTEFGGVVSEKWVELTDMKTIYTVDTL